MLTYTSGLNLYKKLTRNQNSDNESLGATLINLGARKICRLLPWKFLEASKTFNTVDGTQFYDIANNLKTILNVYITSGTSRYTPDRIADRKTWDKLNASSTPESIQPQYYFPFAKQIGFYPTPSTDDKVATVLFKKRVIDLGTADYEEGTITVENGSKAIVGSGSTFTSAMAGRYIQMPNSAWYEIDSFTDTTHITLVDTYDGLDASGETYIIGEAFPIDEDYQELPIYWATFIYWSTVGNDTGKASIYKTLFEEGMRDMEDELKSLVSDPVLKEGIDLSGFINNPNLFINA